MSMVEVTIDSIRISLINQHRIVVLKENDTERYLPIWIGADTAEAISMKLRGVAVQRPMTHDLLKNIISEMGGRVSHIVVSDLRRETFYARIVLDVDGQSLDIDSRPSDALALAVRTQAKIFVEEKVMAEAGIFPEPGLDLDTGIEDLEPLDEEEAAEVGSENLDAFRDFVDTLDLDDFNN